MNFGAILMKMSGKDSSPEKATSRHPVAVDERRVRPQNKCLQKRMFWTGCVLSPDIISRILRRYVYKFRPQKISAESSEDRYIGFVPRKYRQKALYGDGQRVCPPKIPAGRNLWSVDWHRTRPQETPGETFIERYWICPPAISKQTLL